MTCIDLMFDPRRARVFFCLAALLAGGNAAALDFDKVFNDKGEARHMHFRASYTLDGKSHQVEVWRDRDRQLRRRTDEALETFVFKPAKQTEWRMVVLDLPRKIRTDIDRTNLYRIGHFTDWFSMAHGLTRPAAGYRLIALDSAPQVSPAPLAACRWYSLTRSNVESKICWNSDLRLPLLVLSGDGQVQWRITEANAHALGKTVFQVQDQGFVHNDANDDIKGD